MENERLIQAVTEEVMKRLMDILKKQNFSHLLNKKTALLIGTSEGNNNSIYDKLIRLNYDVNFTSNMKDVDTYDLIIVQHLSNLELVNLSLGVPSGQKEETIIQAMLKGKKIYLLADGIEFRKYSSTANENFYNMYKSYENKIIDFGIEIIEHINNIDKDNVNFSNIDNKNIVTNNVGKINDVYNLTGKKLISEVDLRRAMVNGNKDVKISIKTIVTPLAKDFIRTNKLNVIKE